MVHVGVTVQNAKVIDQRDARALFNAAKRRQDGAAVKEQLVLKVARAMGHESLPLKEVQGAAERIIIYKSDYDRYTSVSGDTYDNKPSTYNVTLPKGIGPSGSRKTGYFMEWAGNAFLGLSTLGATLLLATEGYTAPQGVAITVGSLIAGAYGVFKIGKNLVNSWKNKTNRNLQAIANVLETAIIAALSQAKAPEPKQ